MEYQIHLPDYLAKCINKDRPQLHCNGQCVLMKKIRESEEREQKKNLAAYEYSSLYVHREYTTFSMCQQYEENREDLVLPYFIHYTFTYHTSPFHPPNVILTCKA
ncbi:hypothetical protein [Olivibacter ginsenosidimutans]|uniref:hypothetical protein n=1 Tax=Olivibacter ginsenosidimutans TaxID=1176537 RepID=UPI0031E55ACA